MNKIEANQEWKNVGIDGKEPFYLKKLLTSETEKEIEINVLKLEPNTTYPQHSHKRKEWVYILNGDMKDARGNYNKDDLLINEVGSEHQVTSGQNGTEILVIKVLEND